MTVPRTFVHDCGWKYCQGPAKLRYMNYCPRVCLWTNVVVKTSTGNVLQKELTDSPIAKNISFTFIAVFADVSMNKRPLSSAYDWASYTNKAYEPCALT